MSKGPSTRRLDLQAAIRQLAQTVQRVDGTETIATSDARGRVLAAPLRAPVSLPPFAASAMDGYAYGAANCDLGQPLQIVGVAAAGHPFNDSVGRQCCVRIMTGAALPTATDSVVIQEDVVRTDTQISVKEAPTAGANVRLPGHDVTANAPLLDSGRRLTAFDLALLAACGIAHLEVRRRLRVAIFSSGDELIAAGGSLAPGQIYDSNRVLLREILCAEPIDTVIDQWLPDDPKEIAEQLQQATNVDLILTSGGVSVGDTDHLGRYLADHGELGFWRLNLKPGKPVAFGRLGNAWMLGLPGNPVSTAITALLLAKPLLRSLAGARVPPLMLLPAHLAAPIRRRPGREEYQRGQLQRTTDGALTVAPTGDQSSNRLSTFTDADCLIRLSEDQGDCEAGQHVEVVPLYGLFAD